MTDVVRLTAFAVVTLCLFAGLIGTVWVLVAAIRGVFDERTNAPFYRLPAVWFLAAGVAAVVGALA